MISDDDKRKAWGTLGDRIARGLVPWPDYLSREQIDYLVVNIWRNAAPHGEVGKRIRSGVRRSHLWQAVRIVKAQHPRKPYKAIYKELATHYGISKSYVKKAFLWYRKFYKTENVRPPDEDSLASQELPHINFDNFTEE